MILKLERWYATSGKSELHYFLVGPGGRERYVVGFNPDELSPAVRRRILRLANQDLKRRAMASETRRTRR